MSDTSSELAGFPLAQPAAGKPLPLKEGLNPAWAAAMTRLEADLIRPLLGEQVSLCEADWAAMTAGWKSVLEALAREFEAGRAAVDPKRGLATCRNCDLHTLCRVHERLDALGTDEEEGE